ncbi:cell envelope biogenesis protein TolA [Variovorax sp. PAMC28562]|uniref:cell envelope biogenesis protein TolA n=1 Tax=Variovorax sp. PAMC28562 TaxID=2762323 RepID=UPI00164D41D3|nr:cell envelope biogenesis protein TolA [Variovorax sp. PAMC28562]QNK75291.1 cell envelope biogenesis protein TolA [Variovorax sp. PAMC28562]
MTKTLSILLAGLFAAGAYAQPTPPGVPVPPNTPGYATDKSTQAGEMRKDRRPTGMVKAPGGDEPKAPEGGAIGTDKAAVAGEARAETRDQRRPGKRPSTQGGTPK